jgi:hypothetical protein
MEYWSLAAKPGAIDQSRGIHIGVNEQLGTLYGIELCAQVQRSDSLAGSKSSQYGEPSRDECRVVSDLSA